MRLPKRRWRSSSEVIADGGSEEVQPLDPVFDRELPERFEVVSDDRVHLNTSAFRIPEGRRNHGSQPTRRESPSSRRAAAGWHPVNQLSKSVLPAPAVSGLRGPIPS